MRIASLSSTSSTRSRGYPFTLALRIEYALSDDGLAVRTTATNVGTSACPFGSGAHPYLTFGTETVDAVVLQVPAQTVLRTRRPRASRR
jgi:aldose 1-epimerase